MTIIEIMTLEEQLKQFGLHKTETVIYLHLLEAGLSTPPQIARATGIARTNCYNVLESLSDKGLIEVQKHGNRKAYIAADPEALLRNLETKKTAVERLLPDLRALHTVQKNKPAIRFYEGWEQVKQIYWQTLEGNEIYAIGSTKYLSELQHSFFATFAKGLKEKGVMLYDILSNESGQEHARMLANLLKGHYDYAVVPKQFPDFETDILVWGDHVAIIALKEPIFGTVLTNPLLAQSFKTMFKIMRLGIDGQK